MAARYLLEERGILTLLVLFFISSVNACFVSTQSGRDAGPDGNDFLPPWDAPVHDDLSPPFDADVLIDLPPTWDADAPEDGVLREDGEHFDEWSVPDIPDIYGELDGGDTVGGSIVYEIPGMYSFTVPPDTYRIRLQLWGAGGGGTSAEPWGTGRGGDGGHVLALLGVVPGTEYIIVVGGGGRAASCGGGTSGAGGGGHSSFLHADGTPLVSAGGGGGSNFYNSPCSGGIPCTIPVYGVGGYGYGGGGQASDATATDGGRGGDFFEGFSGGAVGSGNCEGTEGYGGFGGGGGGGGTNNGFGGGGGGGGFPGGAGGVGDSSGQGGANYCDPSATLIVSSSDGSAGGFGASDGAPGRAVLDL